MGSIPDDILGTFQLDPSKCENIEKLAQVMGLPFPPPAGAGLPTRTLEKAGDGYKMTMAGGPMGNITQLFTLDTPFKVEKAPDGKAHTVTFRVEGGTLYEDHLIEGMSEKKTGKYCRDGDHLILELELGKIAFKKQ